MTTQDVLSHPQMSAGDFYNKLPASSISDADKEPLKIGTLLDLQTCQQRLRSGRIVSFGEALCYISIDRLCSMFHRKTPLSENEKEFIANEMTAKYKHWSVLDLPTFVTMCVGARLPSQRFTEVEYELVILDIPSILGKLASYERMRPNREALQGSSPPRAGERPWEEWREHCLIDGTPHEFRNTEAAKRYWRLKPDMNDARDRSYVEGVIAKLKSAEFLKVGY